MNFQSCSLVMKISSGKKRSQKIAFQNAAFQNEEAFQNALFLVFVAQIPGENGRWVAVEYLVPRTKKFDMSIIYVVPVLEYPSSEQNTCTGK